MAQQSQEQSCEQFQSSIRIRSNPFSKISKHDTKPKKESSHTAQCDQEAPDEKTIAIFPMKGKHQENKEPENYLHTFKMLLRKYQKPNENAAINQMTRSPETNSSNQITKDVTKKKAHRYKIKLYPMENAMSCRAYVISNETFDHLPPRMGNRKDQETLEELFKFLNFQALVDTDQTGEQMKDKILEFVEKCQIEPTSAAAICILTHGGKGDILYGRDGNGDENGIPIEKTFITQIYVEDNFTKLDDNGIPTILVFQACRGSEAFNPGNLKDSQITAVRKKDMFIINMATPGCQAYRGTLKGSPCLQKFAEIVMAKAHKSDLGSMCHELTKHFQTNEIKIGLWTLPEITIHTERQLFLPPFEAPPEESEESSEET